MGNWWMESSTQAGQHQAATPTLDPIWITIALDKQGFIKGKIKYIVNLRASILQ